VLYFSVKTGEFFLNEDVHISLDKLLSIENLKQTISNLYVYFIGPTILSILMAVAGFIVTWIALKLVGYKHKSN
jgi:hypothetical protein